MWNVAGIWFSPTIIKSKREGGRKQRGRTGTRSPWVESFPNRNPGLRDIWKSPEEQLQLHLLGEEYLGRRETRNIPAVLFACETSLVLN
jgi:hypothetical protein